MKRGFLVLLIFLFLIIINSKGDNPQTKQEKIPIIIKICPSNLLSKFSVYQAGLEFRYKKFGFSAEYGLQQKPKESPAVNLFHRKYYTLRTDGRYYYINKKGITRYFSLEYFHYENYERHRYYQFYTKSGGVYYKSWIYGLSVGQQIDGINIRKGKIVRYNNFEIDTYFGLGIKSIKTKIVYSGPVNKDYDDYWRGFFKPKTGFEDGVKYRPNIVLGIKLAYIFYSNKPHFY